MQSGNGGNEEEGSQCKEKGQGEDKSCCKDLGLHSDNHGGGLHGIGVNMWCLGIMKLISFGLKERHQSVLVFRHLKLNQIHIICTLKQKS